MTVAQCQRTYVRSGSRDSVRRMCYASAMRTITHRQLRNESGAVLRDVEAGESLLISNNGSVVARLSPASEMEPELPVTRPATARGFDDVPLYDRPGNVLDALSDLRGDR
jgi:prevent-host-death family protein